MRHTGAVLFCCAGCRGAACLSMRPDAAAARLPVLLHANAVAEEAVFRASRRFRIGTVLADRACVAGHVQR